MNILVFIFRCVALIFFLLLSIFLWNLCAKYFERKKNLEEAQSLYFRILDSYEKMNGYYNHDYKLAKLTPDKQQRNIEISEVADQIYKMKLSILKNITTLSSTYLSYYISQSLLYTLPKISEDIQEIWATVLAEEKEREKNLNIFLPYT